MEITLYDYEDEYGYMNCIGSGDLSANVVVPKIEASKGQPLTIKIATIGGSVFTALAIYNAMIDHGDVTTINQGYALSAGGLLAMGGKVRKTYPTSMFMMHKAGIDPWMMGRMTADDMQREMNMLSTADTIMIDIFNKFTGISKTKLNNMLAEETWLSGYDAYSLGLFTDLIEIGETKSIQATAFNHMTANRPMQMVALATKNLKVENKVMNDEIINAVNASATKTNGLLAEIKAGFAHLFAKKEDKPVNASATLANGNAIYYPDASGLVEGTQVYEDEDQSKSLENGTYELEDSSTLEVAEGIITGITEPIVVPDNSIEIAAKDAEIAQLKSALMTAQKTIDDVVPTLEKLKSVKSTYTPPSVKQEFGKQNDKAEDTIDAKSAIERNRERNNKKTTN